VIPLLNPDIIKGKGRPKGALGKKNTILLRLGVDITTAIIKAIVLRPTRGRGRGKRGSYTRGNRKSSTRRYPSMFEIDPHEFPTLTTPTRLQKRPIPTDDESDVEDIIKVDSSILPEA
jgi:hypothetical protein